METPQILLEKHINPDGLDGKPITYYVIVVPGFQHTLYSGIDYDKVKERYDHIQEIGYLNYINEITIKKEVIVSEDFNYPELIDELKKNEDKAISEAKVIDTEDDNKEG